MEPTIVVAIVGGIATVAAAGIATWRKSREPKESNDNHNGPPSPPSIHVSAGRDLTDAVIGSTGVSIDRRQVAINVNEARERRPAQLQIVDVAVARSDERGATLDMKVRNDSDEVIFLKRADFKVACRWNIPRLGLAPYAVPVTSTYQVDLAKGSVSVPLAQALEPDGVDRFEFVVGCGKMEKDDRYPFMGMFLFLVDIDLLANENNIKTSTPPILLNLPAPWTIQAASGSSVRRVEVAKNKKIAADLLGSLEENTVVDDRLIEAIRSWAEADLSQVPE